MYDESQSALYLDSVFTYFVIFSFVSRYVIIITLLVATETLMCTLQTS